VAVDGVVYQIEGSPLWVSGRHEPSGGRAQCGKDLTDVIGQSPHGRTKLNLLTVVGRLTE
jgi:predicted heme/steroid binding protein